jgi:hypothetical protein
VQCDQTVILDTFYSAQGYPEPLRRIRYYDVERDKRLIFLTNDFILPATTIAALQVALASRTVFQMDKATSPNKVLLWNKRECRKTTNMDCRINLFAGGNPQKGASHYFAAIHNFADSKPYSIRENAYH